MPSRNDNDDANMCRKEKQNVNVNEHMSLFRTNFDQAPKAL